MNSIISIISVIFILCTLFLSASPAPAVEAAPLAFPASGSSPTCHNATGSCSKTHFVCANEEVIPHSRRCDGVEDCADGTDEYMCDQSSTPLAERTFSERAAITEVSCLKCTCLKGTITVASSNVAWFKIATTAPRDKNMLTGAANVNNKPCNPTATSEIILNVYKKQNKGCRGWVCCFRQEMCKSCIANLASNRCYNV